MDQLFEHFPVTIEQNVAWGDMDALNHVNNTVYFRYFENARIAYFGQINIMHQLQAQQLAPVLASTQCRFRLPLSFPDRITIGARVSQLSADRFTMEYRVVSHKLQRIAAEGEALVVAFDVAKQSKGQLPTAIQQSILDIEKQDLLAKIK